MNNPDFYPTPRHLINRMLCGIDLRCIKTILEPSAGKGDIVDYIMDYAKAHEYHFRYHKLDIDTIEINENLRHILKGKGYRVVHDDFLTFKTYKRYDLIVMNPPFSGGDKHLLKALEIQKNGGKIICLLNAETLRNPYTNTRKDLARRLEELNAEIEYISNAFIDAERKTEVEVALIRADIPQPDRESIILDGLRKQECYKPIDENSGHAVAEADFLKAIVAQYNFEMRAGLNLLNEYVAMKPYILSSIKEEALTGPVIKLKVGDTEKESELWNAYIESIRYKYWKALFDSDVFDQLFTSKLRYAYHEKIQELQHYDFSLFNIYTIKAELIKTMSKSIEDTIIELFDEFSRKHHWQDETSKNIHYYNGWKTNKAWKINKRVIIPLSAFDWSGRFRPVYEAQNKLMDVEKVLNYLDGGRTTEHVDLLVVLKRAEEEGQTKKIRLKYFTVTFYKKGTCHIEFTDQELLKKFNIFGSQKKKWLPPSYGKVKYNDMSAEEQAVIDAFEGKAEYERTMAQKDYYICNTAELLALTG